MIFILLANVIDLFAQLVATSLTPSRNDLQYVQRDDKVGVRIVFISCDCLKNRLSDFLGIHVHLL